MKGNILELDGEYFALDGELEVESYSPFFNREEVVLSDGSSITPQGSMSIGSAKWSKAQLQRAIGYIDKMQVKKQPRKISGLQLVSAGTHVDRVNLYVDRITNRLNSAASKIDFTLITGDRDDFMSKIDGKTLKDLLLNGIVSIPGGDPLNTWGSIVGTPLVQAPQIFGDDFISQVAHGSLPVPPDYDFNDVFEPSGLSPADYNDFAHTAYYATQQILTPNVYFTFPTVVAYQTENLPDGTPRVRMINRWNPTLSRFDTYKTTVIEIQPSPNRRPYTRYESVDNSIVPMFYYNKVLKAVFEENGYTLKDDWLLQDADFMKLTILNSYNIVKPVFVTMDNIYNLDVRDDVCYWEADTEINPKNHMPAMGITEFLKDFMLKFNCCFEVNGKTVTIKHNEFDTTQRVITTTGSNIDIIPEKKQGMILRYNLKENKSYELEDKFTQPFTTMPGFGVPDGQYYESEEQMAVMKAVPFPIVQERQCSNIIPYNSGDAKEFEMPMVAVNCGWVLHGKIYPPIYDFLPLGPQVQFVPFVYADIGGYSPTYHNYEFESDAGPVGDPLGGVWVQQQIYAFVATEAGTDTAGTELRMVGFYHGLKETGDVADVYPYMSFHNWQIASTTTKLGNWNLGILSNEGLIKKYWRNYVNIFNNNRRFIIEVDESIYDIKAHKWNQSIVLRGTQLVIQNYRYKLPIYQKPIIEAFEI